MIPQVNGIIYIKVLIKFEDEFRYKIILENENQKDGRSITSQVNIYYIRSIFKQIPYIRIIDTPGFGDTRGLDYDAKIIDMIKNTFTNECDVITAICFVVKSTETRFNSFQKYIFSSHKPLLFGKQIEGNLAHQYQRFSHVTKTTSQESRMAGPLILILNLSRNNF